MGLSIDREKVIKGLEVCFDSSKECNGCPYIATPYCKTTLRNDVTVLLKEQEAVKPVLDEQTGRIWLCGKCGSYVGFEDNDPDDPNEFDKYCRDCGTPVLWEGR